MRYHEAADLLLSLQRRRPKLGVETTARMLDHLGNPEETLAAVQIAGSNGKGSTARLLEGVLREAGLDVGTFTSPALTDFREQLRVNGRRAPKRAVADIVAELDPCLERLRTEDDTPTHFEALTAVAIRHFAREGCDVAILEVGIGGRYDATSAVDPVASAVTSVSLEHTELLGDTVEEIARDKAQVAPADRPLVTGADGAALAAIREETDVVTVGPADADVVAIEEGSRSGVESAISVVGPDWSLETALQLVGPHQATNAGIAATLARQVADVAPATVATGLRTATWPGRFETVATDPRVVLDGAHNPGAMETLAGLLDRDDHEALHVVFGAMAEKDHEGMVATLPAVETAFVTRPDVDRAADVIVLANAFEGHASRVHKVPAVAEATERALAAAGPDDLVVVTGSLYAVAEARDRWTRPVVPKERGRRPAPGAVFSGAAFDATATDAIDRRVMAVSLRTGPAAAVAEHAAAAGVECHQSSRGAPEHYVETVLAGSVEALETLADAVESDNRGLGRVATELRARLAPSAVTTPSGLGGETTAVMGILNVTPDSFYDGGRYDRLDAAVSRAEEMVANGAAIVDVGGESTRPGAEPVSAAEEADRVVPVVEALEAVDVPVSVDTRKATVADAALEAGADIVNDVSGLADPEMRFVVADHDATLVLMHSQSTPVDPDRTPTYDDVVDDVRAELTEQVLAAERAGIDRSQIVVDPGCGFGKTAEESFTLLDRLGELRALGCPVMVGHSRKSMFAGLGETADDRLAPTLAATALAAERGADLVRVHDVAENAAAIGAVDRTNGS